MASRRLAFNLHQALRSRAALKSIQPVKRGFASPVLPSTTQSTTLSNGFTVRPADPINCVATSTDTS
jgi:processing peptidase subunit beta